VVQPQKVQWIPRPPLGDSGEWVNPWDCRTVDDPSG
jgi:hypothetical protein